MTESHLPRFDSRRNPLFRALADPKRRIVLDSLVGRAPEPVSVDRIVESLTATPPDGVGLGESDARIALHHDVLPSLSSAGLVAYDPNRELVEIPDDGASDATLQKLLAGLDAVSDPQLNAVFDAFTHDRRRTVCDVLRRTNGWIDVESLAQVVAVREADDRPAAVSPAVMDRVTVSLVHAHLPALADAELVAYDETTGRVSDRGHPHLSFDWPDESAEGLPAPRAVATR